MPLSLKWGGTKKFFYAYRLRRRAAAEWRLDMDNCIFESHNLENKNIPLIFHYDKVSGKAQSECAFNWHSNIELLCFMKGSGYVVYGNEKIYVRKGDITVININTIHSLFCNDVLEYYCLIIDNDFLKSNGICCDKYDYESRICSQTLNNLYAETVSAIITPDELREPLVKASLLRLMVYLTKNHAEAAKHNEGQASNTGESIRLAIGYIRSHVFSKLTLDEVAEEVGLSKYHFSREFKKATGMTVVSYINTVRCANAKKLLLKNEYSIHDIAIKCGFENDSYFSKTFKKHIGVLPSDFIKEHNNNLH